MGYTHYWTQNRDFTDSEWQKITEFMHKATENLPFKVCGGWGDGDPVINDTIIQFNGSEEAGQDYETMSLNKNGRGFNFCKTEFRPYDLLVCALLLAATEIAPGALDVSSDGDMDGEDWQPARDFLKAL